MAVPLLVEAAPQQVVVLAAAVDMAVKQAALARRDKATLVVIQARMAAVQAGEALARSVLVLALASVVPVALELPRL